ncbi:MAG: hypothetical protein MI922_14780, partial [Bacteroidales bacterium]|nr:hypothetical protein [Bacteroidales bacterium]
KKIFKLYKHIDEEIDRLHSLSGNDFTSLNTVFKENYQKSKQFFEIQKGLQYDLQKFIPIALSGTRVLEREFNSVRQIIQKQLFGFIKNVDKTEKVFDTLLVPLKNYRQNLLTINFIISHLRVLHHYAKSSDEDTQQKINSLFKELNDAFKVFQEQVGFFKQKLNDSHKYLVGYQQDLNKMIDGYQKRTEWIVEYIKEKQKDIDDYSFKVNYEELIQEYSNEIIVNLQYHDIIRQKMDHVQKTYKDFLISYAGKNEPNGDSENEEKKALPYLANLADLQAAQLTHVNKKYQDAIRNINTSIVRISDRVLDFKDRFENLMDYKDSKNFLDKITDSLVDVRPEKENLEEGINHTKKLSEDLSASLTSCLDTFKKIKQLNIELIKYIKDIIFKDGSQSILNENLYLQLINVSNETTRLAKEIDTNLSKKETLLEGISVGGEVVLNNVELYIDNFDDYCAVYKKTTTAITVKRNEAADLYEQINENKENAGSTLTYYSYFENTVQKIIDELSFINEEAISVGVDISDEEFGAELENIRKLYTMKSEHIIHDGLSGLQDNQIISEFEDDSDNVEFF